MTVCYEGRGGITGARCNFYPKCVCGDREALGKSLDSEIKRLRNDNAALQSKWDDLQQAMKEQFGGPVEDAIDLEIAVKELIVRTVNALGKEVSGG